MIAYSGYVDDQVIINAKKVGFDLVFESPVAHKVIKEVILKFIEQRHNQFKQRVDLSEIVEESKEEE